MRRRNQKAGDYIFDIINVALMLFLITITGYPMLHMLFYSLSGNLIGNQLLYKPEGFSLGYYAQILSDSSILRSFFVSAARTVIGPLSMLAVTAPAAFVMSDKSYVFQKLFWYFFLVTMFIGGGMIPTYLLMRALGLYNNFFVYIVPGMFGVTFNLILMKTYIEQLPGELKDSARIDGANEIYIFIMITLPLITPILATICLFSAVGHWNSWYDTMLYNASRPELYTLQYQLMNIINQFGSNLSIEKIEELRKSGLLVASPAGYRSAVTFITIIPILCVYPFLQKYFTKGLLIGSIKA